MSKQYLPEKTQERIFAVLLKRPENQRCADCTTKGPTWVSLDFGIFICMDCAGAHRALGPSVTRVRSTNIDGWYQENIDIMESIGNAVANSYWEHTMSKSYSKPTIAQGLDSLIRFVQEKYMRKRFIPQEPCIDPKQQYIQTKCSVKPNYFKQQKQEVPLPTEKIAKVDNLLDFTEHDETAKIKNNQHQIHLQAVHSLSPAREVIVQPVNDMTKHSMPSLDIINLYKSNIQQQETQKNANYAYLSNLDQQHFQQPTQQYQYQFYQQPFIPQNNFNRNEPINIMNLYGNK